jgi:biotin carboxyl carrier protein
MKYRLEHRGLVYEVDVDVRADGCVVRGSDGQAHRIAFESHADRSQRAFTPWGELEVQSVRRGGELWARVAGRRLQVQAVRVRPVVDGALAARAVGSVYAPMAGRLLRVDVRVGDAVRAGQPMAVIEAMKMENELVSPLDGVVAMVLVEAPATLEKGALIIKVEPA